MKSILFRNALFALVASLGFAISIMGMDVRRSAYTPVAPNEKETFKNIVLAMQHGRVKDEGIIKTLNANNILLSKMDERGTTLLYWAALEYRLPVVQHIITAGFDIGIDGEMAVNQGEQTPLYAAAKRGARDIVRYLLQMGPSPLNVSQACAVATDPEIRKMLNCPDQKSQATQPPTRPGKELTEDEQLAQAIAESLKEQQPATCPGQKPVIKPAPQIEVGKIPYALQPSAFQEFIELPIDRQTSRIQGFQIRNRRGFDEAGAAPAASFLLQGEQVAAGSQKDTDLSGLIGRVINNQPIDQIISKPEKKWMINTRNSRGQTLLEIAIQRNNIPLVQQLLSLDANPNYAMDAEGMTPLMQAVKSGNKALVEALINGGARVNLYAKDNRTALSLAVFGNRTEIAQLLSSAGGRMFLTMIIAFNPPDQQKFLNTAYTDLARCVGAQINNMPRVDLPEAHLSVLYFSFLIPYGDEATFQAQVHRILDTATRQVENFNLKHELVLLTNNNPFTGPQLGAIGKQHIAINYRAPGNYQKVTDFLFMQLINALNIPTLRTYGEQQNPHISIARNQGPTFAGNWQACTLTGIAAQPLGCVDFIKGSYGLNMRFPRNGTLTTLAPSLIQRDALKGLLPVAIINDDAEFAKTLLDNGADVNEQDEHGNNPLHVAAMRSSREKIITLLLDPKHKAKIDAQNKESYTPLHFAAMNNNSALVELLLKNKANVNVQNKEGNTPLHFAVKNKNTALVNLLLGAGANKDIANKAGKTALDIALDQKDDEMVEIILNFKGLHVELKNGQPLLLAHLNLASYNSLHLLLA